MEFDDLRRRQRVVLLIALLLAAAAFALPARADTVEILVRERAGRPIADQPVMVHPPLAPDQQWWSVGREKVRRERTGADGRVTVDGLPAGSYTITFETISDPNLINPGANPYAPVPTFTLGSGQERVAIEIELWRGVRLTSDVVVDRGDIPPTKVVLRSLDGAAALTVRSSEFGHAEYALVPGRWEAALEFPAGYLLVDVTQNGEARPGATVRIDVLDDTRPQRLGWSLSARALVEGRVTEVGGSFCGGTVVATLVEPGPWYPEIVARGGSEFRRVPAQLVRQDCSYMLWLPDGAWRFEAVGDGVVESIPASVDLSLGPGETRTLTFEVRKGDGKGADLTVRVKAPDGTELIGAVVEVWPAERKAEDRPLRTAKTRPFPYRTEFKGLPAGNYLIVAGHAEYLESSERLNEFAPKDGGSKSFTITLKDGARISGRALDENGKPVPDVELDIVRVGEPAPTLLADKELAAQKASASVMTDLTGRAVGPGLPPGTYRVNARIAGELAGTRFVWVRRGEGKPVPELEVKLEEATRVDLDLVVRPAASLSGSLACTDGRSFPARASFRVFIAGGSVPDPWRDAEISKDAAIALDVRLTGDHLDRFRVGPLPPGAYLLAVRPAGHEFWGWAHGVLVPDAAAVLQATETSSLDIGVTPLECSPLVTIVPRVLSEEAIPDFRLAEIDVALTDIDPTAGAVDVAAKGSNGVARSGGQAKQSAAFAGELERHEGRAFVRRLPEGEFNLSITVRHPYLIPATQALPPQRVDLVRGKLVTLAPAFQRVGGLIEVYVTGAAARLVPIEGEPVIALTGTAKVAFPGTSPGTYRVDACEDAACLHVSHTWERVDVAAARTTILRQP